MRFTVDYQGTLVDGLVTAGRGENRWCMNVIAALLGAGHEVCLWGGSKHVVGDAPQGLVDRASEEAIRDSVFVAYANSSKLYPMPPAKFYVLNYYDLPSYNTVPSNSIVSQSYDVDSRSDKFARLFGDKYVHLPHPAVPAVDEQRDNFGCKRITWTARYLLNHFSGDPRICTNAIAWVAQKLYQDASLEFVFLTGERPPADGAAMLWGTYTHGMSPLIPFKDRVRVLNEVSWGEVLNILRDTKIIINTGHFGHSFGGSSLEAASFGIPTVLLPVSPFGVSPGLVTVSSSSDTSYIPKMDKLFTDHEHYRSVGSMYRDIVKHQYTYPVFVSKLLAALDKRGIR